MPGLRMQSPVGPRVVFDGREYDYFSGTGYLGLQTHPEVVQAGVQALQQYGVSTASSRGGLGEHPVYDELEREACAYFAAEKVLYFPSGYQGITILVQSSMPQFEHIFIDSQAHFSLWDAAYQSNRAITPFHHLQAQSLREALQAELQPGERPLVLSDGVFPISGEIAPLPDYLDVLQPYEGRVYLDDAHAVGVLGEHGWGTPDYFRIQDDRSRKDNPWEEHSRKDVGAVQGLRETVCRTSGTLAKALGGYGGIVWGTTAWIDHIDRESRISAGASPPPLVVAAASARALAIARQHPELRRQLWTNVSRARSQFRELGWDLPDSPVPIICLDARPGISLEHVRQGLFAQGIAVTLVRGYTSTPPGGALRIAIFANHSFEQIDRLANIVRELL